MADVDVDRAGIAVGAVTPDGAQQLLAVEQPAGVSHERVKQLELAEGEAHGLAFKGHLAARPVERDRADREYLGAHRAAARAGASQHRADAAAKLSQSERLGHIVVAAGLETEHGVGLGVERRQHDDRHHVAARPQRPADLVPVGPGTEGDVEQHDVKVLGAGAVDCLATAADSRHVMTLP